jgi:hypothetical protein
VDDSRVGPRQEFDYIAEPGVPIEVHEFGAAERGIGNGGVFAAPRIRETRSWCVEWPSPGSFCPDRGK